MTQESQTPIPSPCAETGATPPRVEQASGFIKGDPSIPALVRVYGNVIAAANIVGIVFTIIGALAEVVQSGNPFALIPAAIAFAIEYVMLRLGQGLYRGERQAVYGICILGGLGIALGVVCLFGSPVAGAIILGLVAVLYAPPIIVAFGRWELFH